MDCDCDGPETEAEDVKEVDEESARQYEILNRLGREWREANDPKLGKVKGNGRSGGRAAPKKDRKANNKEKGKEAEPCTAGRGQRPEPRYGIGAYLRWIAQKARQEKALSELFVQLANEDRQLRLERERKGKEKGNAKEKGKHIEELKSKVKEARETVLNMSTWAQRVVNNMNGSQWLATT